LQIGLVEYFSCGAFERCSTWVGSGLTCKHWTKLERLARDKHSSLLCKLANFGRKSFIKFVPLLTSLLLFLHSFLLWPRDREWHDIFKPLFEYKKYQLTLCNKSEIMVYDCQIFNIIYFWLFLTQFGNFLWVFFCDSWIEISKHFNLLYNSQPSQNEDGLKSGKLVKFLKISFFEKSRN